MALGAAIEVNMADVELGDVVHIRDLSVSDKVEILNDPGITIVSVYVEKVKEEAPAEGEEGEEAAEGVEAEAAPAESEEKSTDNK